MKLALMVLFILAIAFTIGWIIACENENYASDRERTNLWCAAAFCSTFALVFGCIIKVVFFS